MKGNIGDFVQHILAAHPAVLRVIEIPAGFDRPQTKSFLATPRDTRGSAEELHDFFMDVLNALPPVDDARCFEEIGGALWFALIHLRSHHSNPPDHKVVFIDHVELRLLPDDALVDWVTKRDRYCINPDELAKILWLNKKLPWVSKLFQVR